MKDKDDLIYRSGKNNRYSYDDDSDCGYDDGYTDDYSYDDYFDDEYSDEPEIFSGDEYSGEFDTYSDEADAFSNGGGSENADNYGGDAEESEYLAPSAKKSYIAQKNRPLGKRILRYVLVFALLAILIASSMPKIMSSFYETVQIKGASMENTLFDGDVVYAKTTEEAKRGDVVIIDETAGESENRYYIVKRVIALGGDSIKHSGGVIYVKYVDAEDFVPVPDDYVKEKGLSERIEWLEEDEIFVIPEDEAFFLGDNRRVSSDSRYGFKTCKVSQIHGVVSENAIEKKSRSTKYYNFKMKLKNILNFGATEDDD